MRSVLSKNTAAALFKLPSRLSSTSSISPTRHLSSARPLPIREEEDDYNWTAPNTKIQPVIRQNSKKLEMQSTAVKEVPHAPQGDIDERVESPLPPSELVYTGDAVMPITSILHIVTPEEDVPRGTWPVFRLMDDSGLFRDPAFDGFHTELGSTYTSPPYQLDKTNSTPPAIPYRLDALRAQLQKHHPFHAHEIEKSALLQPHKHNYPDIESDNTLLRAHRQMVRLREMDTILQNAQRQGRISFYMTCRGEEAIHIGAASALELQDTVLAQYREAGLLMWRGFTLEQFTNQCFSNDADLGKGRQMPVHYGSRALNYHTVSSPLGTQLPQAVGAAYRLKLQGKSNVAIVFFGDGCASTTDFHSACNFAATLHAPVIFFCRNNGYAISTPVTDQYAGDGIISRAPGYGMAGIRVDGNDIFAVNAAVREAKKYALAHSAPVMIEAMTYRQGHHSTSDDSTRYRSAQEVHSHAQNGDPLARMDAFLTRHGWMDKTMLTSIWDEEKFAVLKAIEAAETRPKPPLEALFEDVYHTLPPHLKHQEEQLRRHMAKYPKKYT